jgi:hypothetical protein
MRTALLAALVTLPTLALAQDASAPPTKRPTGTTLLDALPAQADVVVDVPDLPALLESMSAAGLGDATSWRAAFDAQLRAWGADAAAGEKLVKGGGALLAAADGEALAASISLKLPDAKAQRATLLALRSSKDEATLRAAFTDLIDGGLKARYLGDARQEEIAGRRVHVLYGNRGNLFIHVSNGFVAVSDHPLALGLFFKGFAKDALPPPENRPTGSSLKLVVRYGRGDAAWDGWIWGEAETVEWKDADAHAAMIPDTPSTKGVCVIAWPRIGDVPLMPAPLSEADRARLELATSKAKQLDKDSSLTHLYFDDEGEFAGCAPLGVTGAAGNLRSVPGGAWRLGWLRALAFGKFPTPFGAFDVGILRRPLAAAVKEIEADADRRQPPLDGEFLAWKSTQPGRMSGPLGHGPATFLALRCLHDIGHGVGPGEAAPPPEPERPTAPLPPPTEPRDK